MAKAVTIKVKLVSSADTGFYYVAKKNSRTMTDKMVKKKYDPVARSTSNSASPRSSRIAAHCWRIRRGLWPRFDSIAAHTRKRQLRRPQVIYSPGNLIGTYCARLITFGDPSGYRASPQSVG